MREYRLEIYIDEHEVLFHGKMSIREAFDFLNYFDKEGFDEVFWGEENSCLRLTKKTPQQEKFRVSKEEFDRKMKEKMDSIPSVDELFGTLHKPAHKQ